jgi:lipoprotein-releasing system ATP-binding protein
MNNVDVPQSAAPTPLVLVENLQRSFQMGNQTVHVLNGITMTIQRGEMVAIIGASGAGKSTLLHILGTLDRPTKGDVLFEGKNMFRASETALASFRNRRIGFVFQFHHLLPEFTALENVYLPALIQKIPKDTAMKSAKSLLSEVSSRPHTKDPQGHGHEVGQIPVIRSGVIPSVRSQTW